MEVEQSVLDAMAVFGLVPVAQSPNGCALAKSTDYGTHITTPGCLEWALTAVTPPEGTLTYCTEMDVLGDQMAKFYFTAEPREELGVWWVCGG